MSEKKDRHVLFTNICPNLPKSVSFSLHQKDLSFSHFPHKSWSDLHPQEIPQALLPKEHLSGLGVHNTAFANISQRWQPEMRLKHGIKACEASECEFCQLMVRKMFQPLCFETNRQNFRLKRFGFLFKP